MPEVGQIDALKAKDISTLGRLDLDESTTQARNIFQKWQFVLLLWLVLLSLNSAERKAAPSHDR
jgi:hypothetical protein